MPKENDSDNDVLLKESYSDYDDDLDVDEINIEVQPKENTKLSDYEGFKNL